MFQLVSSLRNVFYNAHKMCKLNLLINQKTSSNSVKNNNISGFYADYCT
jgi:hypothetical protein